MLNSVVDLVTITPGKLVEVWSGFTTSTDTKVFSGYVETASPERAIISLTCKDKMWDLIRKNVNAVYESSGPQAGVISAIAEDLIETHGGLTASVVATGTATGQTLDEFRCNNTDIWGRLVALAKAVDYQIFYDAVNDTVHFEPKGYSDSGLTLTVGTEILGMPKWSDDTSRMVNDLRVDGAVSLTQIRLPNGTGTGQIDTTTDFDTDGIVLTKTPESVELIMDADNPPVTVKIGGTKDASSGHFYYVDRENKKIIPTTGTTFTVDHYAIVNYTWYAPSPIHQINQDSIDTYGSFEKQSTLTDVTSVIDAEARTAKILNTFSEPFKVGEFLLKSSSTLDLNIGDKVTIIDGISRPNVNEVLVVTNQVLKYPASNQEITVGDESIRLAGWQINVEERLKRIEEQLSLKNQDIILELRDFSNSMTLEPRYRKILKADVITTNLIWGSPDYGIWEIGKWGTASSSGETNHFVQQYLDSYDETFIDSDFKDTDETDCTWDDDGSITFMSGQIAQSLSIDYNNSTITTVTLTSTEVSGSFTYELTADGTNWEEVISGTAHTFTDTGTDLRWRATEDNTSTGEISELKLESYH